MTLVWNLLPVKSRPTTRHYGFQFGVLAAPCIFRQNILEPSGDPWMTSSQAAPRTVFTVGHSNLELEEFLSTLSRHRVQAVCDVRSRPASFRFPQFNREPLEVSLRDAGFRYEFLGESLGEGQPIRGSIRPTALSIIFCGEKRAISWPKWIALWSFRG